MLVMTCSKSSKLDFITMWTENFQMYKLDLEKAGKPEIKLPTSIGSLKKQENSRKKKSASLTMQPLTVWITTNWGKFFMIWDFQTILVTTWETYMQVKKQQLEPDMEQQTGSKSVKKCVKVYIVILLNLYREYLWNARLDETEAGIKIAGRNINNIRHIVDTPLWQNMKRN